MTAKTATVASKIELWPLDRIKPYERNPRKNDHAVAAVASSIQMFGFKQPILVDRQGVIIVGHTRWKAAKHLQLAKAPVIVARDMTFEQAKAYRIADNKTGELADWDFDLLPIELRELEELDIDLASLGFDADELQQLLAPAGTEGLCDPDDIPAPPDAAITQPGDLIILGNHRLLCGDSSITADVDRLLGGGGEVIHLVNTDPPYNVKVEPRSNAALKSGTSGGFPSPEQSKGLKSGKLASATKLRPRDRALQNDFLSDGDFEKLLDAWFGQIARVLQPGRAFYIWGGYGNWKNYCAALDRAGHLHFAQGITWYKQWPVLSRTDFMNDCEHAWYGWREGAAHQFFGEANISNVWAVKRLNPVGMIHLTEKPVELAARAIQYSSKAGENVFDLFGGSGSTLIAAEQLGRRSFLMELDPLYCDVIISRWEKFSGKKAQRPGRASRTTTPKKTPARAGVKKRKAA